MTDDRGTATRALDEAWKSWIRVNVERGCDKDELYRVLIDSGFTPDEITRELDHEPTRSLEEIRTPLLSKTEAQRVDFFSSTSQVFLPNALRVDADTIELYEIDGFLDYDECRALLDAIMAAGVRRSTITTEPVEPDKEFRTSRTSDLSTATEPIVAEVDRRICQMIGIHPSFGEPIQAQLYTEGQEFKTHTDYFEPETEEFETYAARRGQRTWTFMIYLNDTESGGETRFVNLNKSFYPKSGKALVWNNLYPSGQPNPDTLHQGMPVVSGTKAIITKWFRTQGEGPMYVKEDNEYIANFTHRGFKQSIIPKSIIEPLQSYYGAHCHCAKPEVVEGFIFADDGATASELIELPDSLRRQLHSQLRPLCEEWSGVELEPTYVYGIRCYRRGANLRSHRDRQATHIISAILNIDQQVNSDWPLVIDDNFYRSHSINLRPGEMVLYEGGRLNHGRPEPLDGDFYCNVFVHFRPVGYVPPRRGAGVDMNLTPRHCAHCAIEEYDGRVRLVNQNTGDLLECNQSVAAIWVLCDGSRTLGQCVAYLEARYPGSTGMIASDVGAAANELELRGFITLE